MFVDFRGVMLSLCGRIGLLGLEDDWNVTGSIS
jgi:hypothetical protein